jgi:hypothetical protein
MYSIRRRPARELEFACKTEALARSELLGSERISSSLSPSTIWIANPHIVPAATALTVY